MVLDFDVNSKHKNTIELLDCQIDLILKSLEFQRYLYDFIYPRSKKSKTLEENLRISLINDTYDQIFREFQNQKNENILKKIA